MKNKNAIIFLAALGLVVSFAVIGRQFAGASTSTAMKRPMPHFDGEKAKQYLEQNGLDKSLTDAIQHARYGVNRINNSPVKNFPQAFEAKNHQQEFAAYFSDTGANLVSRAADNPWDLSIKLDGIELAAEGWRIAEGPKRWSADKTKISATHLIESEISNLKFPIEEIFENKPEGLEQTFTIEKRPTSNIQRPEDDRLKLVLSIKGDLQSGLSGDGQALIFRKAGANVLRYDKLRSWDATGKELASVMELSGDELYLVVNDADAIYPITVDPTFTQVKKLTASDGATGDIFGQAIAIDGDTAIIGAFGDNTLQGSAYVFQRNAGGANNWSEVKKLAASDGATGDQFGASVAIESDTIIVGASEQEDINSSADSPGAIYIFNRNAGGANNWGQVVKRVSSDGMIDDHFGTSVDISGDTLIVGATGEFYKTHEPGAAYIFERNAGGANNWGQVRKIEIDDFQDASLLGESVSISGNAAIIGGQQASAAFIVGRNVGGPDNWGVVKKLTASLFSDSSLGNSVDIDSDTAIVNSLFEQVGGSKGQGAAYIYQRDLGGGDNWGEVKRIVASDGAAFDLFGSSVVIDGDRIVVGAASDQNGTNVFQGSAYVFERNAGGADNWGQVKKILAAEGVAGDRAGSAVALDGNTTIVGAPGINLYGNTNRGSAFVFVRSNDTWVQTAKPLPGNCTVEDYLGGAVAIDGDTAIISAQSNDVGSNANQGAAYIFERSGSIWILVKTIVAADGAANDFFGRSVALSGNMVVVGEFTDDTGVIANQGAAYVFERNAGGPNNWGQVKKLTASDGAAEDWFGWSVGISGNTIIVGAILDDVGTNNTQGSAYIFERNAGGANNWGEVKHIIASDGAFADTFGKSVAVSGDTAVVGSDLDDIGSSGNRGSVYIFERNNGGTNNWGELRKIIAEDGATGDQFGVSVAVGGNTLIVGAWQDDVDTNNAQGSAYIYERNTGGANNWGQVKRLIASDGAGGDFFGGSVEVSGDTAIVGSSRDQIGANTNQGSAYVFRQNAGGVNNWGEVRKITAADGEREDYFGNDVAISGDTAIVGVNYDDVGGTLNQGSARIFVSSGGTWNQQALLAPPPVSCGADDQYGFAVAVSGDTAVIGAPFDEVGINANQGSVYILERNAGGINNWGVVKLLTASDGAVNDFFGFSVAISGNRVIVGAPGGIGSNQGSAYIFERSSGQADDWGEVKKIVAADGAAGDRFGNSVSISSNTAIVGAVSHDIGSNEDQGAGYVFEQNAGGANNWGQVRKLVAADAGTQDFFYFGSSVAISGDAIIVGAFAADITSNAEGTAYIFERNTGGAGNWGQIKKLVASDGAAEDQFGNSVAISGNTAIVGADFDDTGENTTQGSAYIYEQNAGGANNWGQIKKLVAADGAAGDFFGNSVSISGDTAFVGSPGDNIGANNDQGSAYIFHQNAGGADNWGQVGKSMAIDGAAGDLFGFAVAVGGDNFLVGAYLANVPAFAGKHSDGLLGGNAQGVSYAFRGTALAPTAASVRVSGRVLTADGRGIAKTRITLTDANGETRAATTGSFGYYRFETVPSGGTYIISAAHKQYRFTPRILSVTDEILDLNFTAEN